MPEAEPEPQPKRRRRWLRRLLAVAGLVAVALALAAILAVRNLEWIARWSIQQFFPGVRAELGEFRVVSPTRLEVRRLALTSARTGEPLLALENGSATFRFSDVWRLRLEEVHLDRPDLVVSPDLGDALGTNAAPKPATSDPAAAPGKAGERGFFGWGIDRLRVTDGHLRVTRFFERSPSVDLDFSADLRNFGVGGPAGSVEHAARFKKIAATDENGRPFLGVADAELRFSTDELFSRDRVRAIRIGRGRLTVAPDLLSFLDSPKPATASAASPAGNPPPKTAGWSVGSLNFDGVDVVIVNAPGPVGRVEFHVAAELRDLGETGTPAANARQNLAVRDLRVSTDRFPGAWLLAADAARAAFTSAGLRERRIEDFAVENPVVDFSPEAFVESAPPQAAAAPVVPASPAAAPDPAKAWFVGRAVCSHGTLRASGLRDGSLDVSTHFAFDFQNFGPGGDAAQAPQQLTVWDAQAGRGRSRAFVSVDAAQVRFTPGDLLERRRIEAVKITGGRVIIGEAFQKLLEADAEAEVRAAGLAAAGAPAPAQAAPATPADDWSIGALDIFGVRLRLEEKRPDLPDLRMTLNTSLRDIATSGLSTQLFDEVQTVELTNIDLKSPINPGAKIFTLRSVFLRFTLRDIAAKHLREIVVRGPIIYLSQDLFVYMERVGGGEKTAGAPTPSPPSAPKADAAPAKNWSADRVDVRHGKLVIGSGGQKDVGLPLEFETTLEDVALDNLAKLRVQAALRVPRQSYDFPDYQLAVDDVEGDLRFAYPPEKGEKNLVQKLDIRKIRWRQFESKKSWVAATFDARGINGQFGGESFDGYVNGGFSFKFRDDAPWQGWVAGTGIDTKALTDVMSPQNFRLTGPLDFEIQTDAFRKDIARVAGNFRVTKPGQLRIGKIDDLLANLPAAWSAIKASSTRIALETLRDFDYTRAGGDFWFVESQGILGLNLTGPLGSRTFEVVLHDDQDTTNPWQRGKLGKE